MTMTSISVIMTVVVLNFHWRSPEKYLVSDWIKRVVLGKLAYIMCIDTDFNCRDVKESGPPLRLTRHTQLSQDDPEFVRQTNLCSIPMQPLEQPYQEVQVPENFNQNRSSVQQRRQMFAASSNATSACTASLNEDTLTNHVSRRSNHLCGMSRPPRSQSRDRLQLEVVKALSLLIARQEQDDGIMEVRKQWRQVAQVLDRCLFWLFFVATVSSTFIMLVILPMVGDKGISDPVENTI
jgi:Neurotransmitter-gated ion-channel transmembrane region